MSNRDVLLHKADLLAALHDEGKPVELHHALRVVRELRTALADYEADAIHTCGPDCKRPLCVMRAELAALRAQEPVAWMTRTDTERVFWMNSPKSIFHDATPLYAAPAPAAVPTKTQAESVARGLEDSAEILRDVDGYEEIPAEMLEAAALIRRLAAPATAAVPDECLVALRDLLWALAHKPSCQRFGIYTCCCKSCAVARANTLVHAAAQEGK